MSLLSEIVGQAKQQAKLQVDGVKNEVRSGVRGAISNAENNVRNAVRGTVSNVARSGVNSIISAASSLISGNVDGAIQAVTSAPGNLVDAVVNGALGRSLSNPLSLISGSSFSGSGGIAPGDALAGAQARADPMMSYCWYAMMPIISPPAQQSSFGSALGGTAGTMIGSALGGLGNSSPALNLGGIGGAIGSAVGSSVFSSQGASNELPWYFVETASLPMRQLETVEIFREGRDRKYPSKYSIDDMTLGVYLDSNNQAFKYFKAWHDQIVSPFNSGDAATSGGGFGRPVNYKKTIRIFLLAVNRRELVQIEYTECWPTSLTGLELNGQSDRLVAQVPISVGDVFVTALPVSSTDVEGVVAQPETLPGLIQYAAQSATSQVFNIGTTLAKKAINSFF